MNAPKLLRHVTPIGCAVLLGWAATSANAGEITGNGKPIEVKGKSECAFSGQQDDPDADAGFFRGDRVQNWGQIPKWLRDLITLGEGSPGEACNPAKSGDEDP